MFQKDLPHRGPTSGESLAFFVRGSNFQVRVWEALLKIPPGATATYGDIAKFIGPQSQPAVAQRWGPKLVSFLIPCHRVIRARSRRLSLGTRAKKGHAGLGTRNPAGAPTHLNPGQKTLGPSLLDCAPKHPKNGGNGKHESSCGQ
ncbi:MAG: hypothetical protein Ct9H300mP16_09430 [Pseudomonadota bacterium]|nr:MAG: hypothetical protein Ct9H300mP16_09430 [Pseudomonadota bacterium]